jgi:hypothetical protein
MTNPENTWVNNVAAGSEESGFWMEMRDRVREPTRGQWLPDDYNPKRRPLLKFKHNVAHSNSNDGLQTYPSGGYRPEPYDPADPNRVGARFEEFKSYRNRAAGIFFHVSENLEVVGGLFADNDRGIDIDRSHWCRVSPSPTSGAVRIVGVSELYQSQLKTEGQLGSSLRSHCYSAGTDPIIGVHLHEQNIGGSTKLGAQLEGIVFSRLTDAETGCTGGRALGFDREHEGYTDSRTATRALSWEPAGAPLATRINLCAEYSETEPLFPNAVVRDVDGSLSGAGAGFFVSDAPLMTALVGSPCSSVAGACAAFCPGVCLRQLEYRVSSFLPATTKLRLTRGALFVDAPAYYDYGMEDTPKETLAEHTEEWDRLRFWATVPDDAEVGAHFVDEAGSPIDPLFVQTLVADEPFACSANPAQVALARPARAGGCGGELVTNGAFDASSAVADKAPGWWHDYGGIFLAEEALPDGSVNKYGLISWRSSYWHGPSQWLDTRCFAPSMAGGKLVLRAQVKLYEPKADGTPDNSSPPSCFTSMGGCARAELRVEYSEASGKPNLYVDFAYQTEFVYGEWNLVAGEIELDEELLAGAEAVRVKFEGPPASVDLAIDDVSLTYTPPVAFAPCARPMESMLVNGDFALRDSFGIPAGWETNQLVDQLVVESDAASGFAQHVRSYARTHDNDGPVQELNPACWSEPAIYQAQAHVKLVRPDGTTPRCYTSVVGETNDCPEFMLIVKHAGGTDYHDFGKLYSKDADGFNVLHGNFHYDAPKAGIESVRFAIREADAGVEMLVADVTLMSVWGPTPMALSTRPQPWEPYATVRADELLVPVRALSRDLLVDTLYLSLSNHAGFRVQVLFALVDDAAQITGLRASDFTMLNQIGVQTTSWSPTALPGVDSNIPAGKTGVYWLRPNKGSRFLMRAPDAPTAALSPLSSNGDMQLLHPLVVDNRDLTFVQPIAAMYTDIVVGVAPVCTAEGIVRNRNMFGGLTAPRWEGRYDSPLVRIEEASGARAGWYVRSYGRTRTYHGPIQYLPSAGCRGMSAGTSMIIHAWVKLVVPPGGSSSCSDSDASRCITCRRESVDANGNTQYRFCGYQSARAPNEWSLLEDQFTVQADEVDGKDDWKLYFEGPEEGNEILLGDVWMGELSALI